MINIIPFEQRDLEKTIECVSQTFPHEAMSKVLEIDRNGYRIFAEIVCQKALEDQLSLVAKDSNSGNIMGFIFLEDLLSEFPILRYLDLRFSMIMELLGQLYEEYNKHYKVTKPGEILHLFMIGVSPLYWKQGIANLLLKESLKLAQKNSYRKIISECTGLATQHLMEREGFKTVYEIVYSHFVYNGDLVFKNLKTPPTCKLMLKTFDVE